MAHVGNDSNDGDPRCATVHFAKFDALADGIAMGPEVPRQGLADDHDRQGWWRVIPGKIAPLPQWDSHYREITGRNGAEIRERHLTWSRRRLTFHGDTGGAALQGERKKTDCANTPHSGQRLHSLNSFPVKGSALWQARVAWPAQNNSQGEHMVRPKSERDLFKTNKASQQQTRADENDDAKRHFHDDEKPARANASNGSGIAASFFQFVNDFAARRLPCRK